jgi:hypothetical protein
VGVGGVGGAEGWVNCSDEGHALLRMSMLQARLNFCELYKVSSGSKVVWISGQDLIFWVLPLFLTHAVSVIKHPVC